MKNSNDSLILGIDHGYGNIKTANKTFSTGVYKYRCLYLKQRIPFTEQSVSGVVACFSKK